MITAIIIALALAVGWIAILMATSEMATARRNWHWCDVCNRWFNALCEHGPREWLPPDDELPTTHEICPECESRREKCRKQFLEDSLRRRIRKRLHVEHQRRIEALANNHPPTNPQ